MAKLKLHGVIPALSTPFHKDRSLDIAGFRRLAELVIADGVHGLLINGCTGESWALESDERFAIFKAAVEVAGGRLPVIAGCGAMLTKEAIAKVRQAEAAGCDAAMLQPPWYVLPGPEEVRDYYLEIMAATSLPVVLYNIPRRTGISLSVELVDRLADAPKVIALKESSKDFLLLSDMIRRVGDRIQVFAGYANLLGLAALSLGAAGYMDSSTPVLGRRSLAFYKAATSGDLEAARRMQAEMSRLNAGFFGVGTFPAGVKVALDMLGRPGGWPRDPVKPLNDEQKGRIRTVLEEAGLLTAADPRAAAD
ncbi:MAG: dihydrodipicolinate synthase family protein [Proteobacteria bacterium]|nr:dihydrodipicolinate synthase family protein [Pseudomonadota bacterium]